MARFGSPPQQNIEHQVWPLMPHVVAVYGKGWARLVDLHGKRPLAAHGCLEPDKYAAKARQCSHHHFPQR
eukprot:scaffold309750_cov22-Tisochrysis_lutea.AAC.1